MKLFILRHFPTADNELGINGSQTDTPLSKSGEEQAIKSLEKLSENTYDLFIVSTLQRTLQTIQPYLDTLDNPEIIREPLTIERDLGLLTNSRAGDGKIKKHREEQGTDRISWKPPGGESILDVYERAKIFLTKINKLEAGTILICGHQNFLRCFEMILLNRPIEDFYSSDPPRLENGEIRLYNFNGLLQSS
jgi:broad specificity phosphatase PhoE